jgi:hypothetical protein
VGCFDRRGLPESGIVKRLANYGTLGKNQLVPAAGAAGWQRGAHRPG